MIFDIYGLPKDMGASDFADSARLAALMAVCGMEKAPNLLMYDLSNYYEGDVFSGFKKYDKAKPKYVRHPYATVYPENEPRCMSRDQLICLAAGYKAQGLQWKYYDKWFAPNNMNEVTKKWKIPDVLWYQHNNHLRICAGLGPSEKGDTWLEKDLKIFTSGRHQLDEPNQMISMLLSHPDKKYIRYWKNNNPMWRQAIEYYWYKGPGEWRGEKELAELLIDKVASA